MYASLAQGTEQRISTPPVRGSNPLTGALNTGDLNNLFAFFIHQIACIFYAKNRIVHK